MDPRIGTTAASLRIMSLPAGTETSIAGLLRVGNSEPRAVGPDLKQGTKDPGILSSIVRAWIETLAPGREAPKERAISAVSTEALAEEIPREVHPKVDLEPMDPYSLEGTVTKVYPVLAVGHRRGAGSRGEDPEVEVMEGLPEVVSAAVDWVEASDTRSNLNRNVSGTSEAGDREKTQRVFAYSDGFRDLVRVLLL
jgi:hypothetical protein